MGAVEIGGGPAVLGKGDVGVLHQVVLLINDRALAPDKDHGLSVVQEPDFIRGHQLPARLLGALGIGAAAPLALAAGAGADGFLPQQLGDVLVGALFVAAQIHQGVGVADDALPVILEQGLQLGDVLQNDGGHDVPGTHGGLKPCVAIRQSDIGELVEHEPHRHRQRPLMHLVRLVIQLLKGLGVEHPHQEVQGVVVAVGDDAEDRLLPFPQPGQLQAVLTGDVLNLRQGKGRQPHGGGHQDGFGGLSGGLLEDAVLPQGDVAGVFLLQSFKEQIQGRLVVLVVFLYRAVLDHGQHHFHGLLLRGSLVEQVEHQGSIQGRLGLLPEGVVLAGVLGRGVLDEVIEESEHV